MTGSRPRCLIDALPELYQTSTFARSHYDRAAVAHYDRHSASHEYEPDGWSDVNRFHINRLQALDTLMDHFRSGSALLPREARGLGGRPKDGLGDYYRQLLALKRKLERDAQGNWTPRWLDNGRADHYAHAEVYCMLADEIRPPRWIVL